MNLPVLNVFLCNSFADGRLGWPENAPYDAIHVGAAAPEIPQPLIDQLKPGGRLVIPVGKSFQDLKVVDKKIDGSVTIQSKLSVRYVPLTSRAAQLQNYWGWIVGWLTKTGDKIPEISGQWFEEICLQICKF